MKDWTYPQIEKLLESFSVAQGESNPRALKRQRILKAATELFIQHGYRKTSVDEVARESGVAKGTVYLYFKTKADLLAQAIVEEKKRFLVKLQPVLEAPPKQRLGLYVRMALVVLSEMPLMSKLMSGDREVLWCSRRWTRIFGSKRSVFNCISPPKCWMLLQHPTNFLAKSF